MRGARTVMTAIQWPMDLLLDFFEKNGRDVWQAESPHLARRDRLG